MGNDNNAARSAQLGMPFGTASGRLRKAIMFKYVQLAGHDKCFKCGLVIEDIDHLSIEHKMPWQGRDTALFWDLDNIAFSHLRCNTPHHHPGSKPRYVGPEGTRWCSGCRVFHPESSFNVSNYKSAGLQSVCRVFQVNHKRERRKARRALGLPVK
jgi:hypothetical protein